MASAANSSTKTARLPRQKWTYAEVFRASPVERVRIIRGGVSARWARSIFTDLGLGTVQGYQVLGLAPATVNRKATLGSALTLAQGERVVGVARMIGQVQHMTERNQAPPGFDPVAWFGDWLRSPLPAFGGACPMQFLDTMEGQALVSSTLEQMESGAYS